MNLKNRFKKFGFSLMEILIAVFIVAILALVTMPVFNKQINKTNEYSYYLAYQSVEKIAGQIVALGDPKDNSAYVLPDSTLIADNKNNFDLKLFLANSPVNKFISNLSDRFLNTQAYILSKFLPKTVAAETVERPKYWGSWSSEDFDEIWTAYQVCKNNRENDFPKKTTVNNVTNSDGSTSQSTTIEHYKKADFSYCMGYTRSGYVNYAENEGEEDTPVDSEEGGETKHSVLLSVLFPGRMAEVCNSGSSDLDVLAESVANALTLNNTATNPDAQSFCNSTMKSKCKSGGTVNLDGISYRMTVDYNASTPEEGEEEDEDDEEAALGENETAHEYPASLTPGSCTVNSTYTININSIDETQYMPDRELYDVNWCENYGGYYQMVNMDAYPNSESYTIDCQCDPSGTKLVTSTNSEKACVRPCQSAAELPYVKSTKNATTGEVTFTGDICCSTDFDVKNNKCCPEKSIYNPNSELCECVSGYEMNASRTKCDLKDCPAGSHPTSDGVCVVNPPIILGKRLCEEISEHWNVDERMTNCNTFVSVGSQGIYHAYPAVYSAALHKSDSSKFLSVNSKIGAFKNLAPNLELSNGLKIWILGDKAASIPGLSYYGQNISVAQNMCAKKSMTKHDAISCYNEGGYFCKSENTCLVIDETSKTSGAIGDARGCCSASDITDLQDEAASKGDAHKDDWKLDQRVYGIPGFTIFVDINGDRGDGTLWDDVFPFYIGSNGLVYPGYPLDAPKEAGPSTLLYTAGNSETDLPVDVYYYKSNDVGLERKVAFSGISYARAMCSARKISKNTPYCMNLGANFNGGDGLSTSKCPTQGGCTNPGKLVGTGYNTSKTGYLQVDDKTSKNPCDHYNCFVAVRKKLRSF